MVCPASEFPEKTASTLQSYVAGHPVRSPGGAPSGGCHADPLKEPRDWVQGDADERCLTTLFLNSLFKITFYFHSVNFLPRLLIASLLIQMCVLT